MENGFDFLGDGTQKSWREPAVPKIRRGEEVDLECEPVRVRCSGFASRAMGFLQSLPEVLIEASYELTFDANRPQVAPQNRLERFHDPSSLSVDVGDRLHRRSYTYP